MQQLNEGSICLVGAGPEDPELITLKGLKAIQNAEVILYNALINPLLLKQNSVANKIFVGNEGTLHKKLKKRLTSYWCIMPRKTKKLFALKVVIL